MQTRQSYAHAQSALRAQGFALLESALEPALMDELRGCLDRCRREEEQRFGLQRLHDVGQRGYVSDVFRFGAPFSRLLDSDVLHGVLSDVFGADVRLYVAQGIILDPGQGRGIWPRCWHADMFQVRKAVGDATFCFGLNCLVLVDDMNEQNGPTCLLPGSQALEQLASDSVEDIASREFRTVAPSGSLLLVNGGTWHSAGTNRSTEPRRVIKLLFTRRWLRPQLNYAGMFPREALPGLTSRAERLF